MMTPEPLYRMMVIDSSEIIAPREDYQRELKSERVKRIVSNFDERIANEPKVSYRDGKYYVSETTTGERTKKSEPHKGEKYIAVSEQITSRIEYKKFLKAEAKYSTLEEAYDAYVKALAKDEYKGVREKCL